MSAVDTVFEQLGSMTVLELVELKKKIEEEWGITAAAPVAVAAAAGAAGAGGDGAGAVEEKTEFDVVLTGAGDKKIQVIKVVRAVTGSASRRPRISSTARPKAVKEGVPRTRPTRSRPSSRRPAPPSSSSRGRPRTGSPRRRSRRRRQASTAGRTSGR